jgi:hypothetical protein
MPLGSAKGKKFSRKKDTQSMEREKMALWPLQGVYIMNLRRLMN